MKATLCSSKGIFHGRHGLGNTWTSWWCFISLLVLVLAKKPWIVLNRKQEEIDINVLLKAGMILDDCVTLPTNNSRMALVTSSKRLHKKYWVHNPKSKWASCDYPYAQHGNICMHQNKVLQLLHPKFTKGMIAHYYGVLKGTVHGGLQSLLSLTR
jgi:hypothetical protein